MQPLSRLQLTCGSRVNSVHLVHCAAALLALIASLGLSGCGGGSRTAQQMLQPASFVEAPQTVKASLPALPDVFVGPRGISAATDVLIKGNSYWKTGAHSSAGIGTLDFNPAVGEFAWGLYQFGAASDETVQKLSFDLSGLDGGEQAWIAISDYSNSRWSFFPVQTSASGEFDLSASAAGRYTSPGGAIYVAVLSYANAFSVMDVSLTFPERYNVTGTVHDAMGNPMEGVTIRSIIGNSSTLTDASGAYSLPALPDGTWPILATEDGYSFYDTPTLVTVNGGDGVVPDIIGCLSYSNYSSDAYEPNNQQDQAYEMTQHDSVTMTLSAAQDPVDFLKITCDTPGSYAVRFRNPDNDIYYPQVQINDALGSGISGADLVLQGQLTAPFVMAKPGVIYVRVSLDGGGGEYTIDVVDAPDGCHGFTGQALETGQPRSWRPLLISGANIDGFVKIFSGYDGPYEMHNLLAGQYSIAPDGDGSYSYAPPSQNIDLSTGDQSNVDFALTATAFIDSYEPNNSEPFAHDLGLISTSLDVSGMTIGPTLSDGNDFYSFTTASGKGFKVTMQAYTNGGQFAKYSMFMYKLGDGGAFSSRLTSGGLEFREISDNRANIIWIQPGTGKSEITPYSLHIEVFDGYKFQAKAALDGLPLKDVHFRITSPGCTWTEELSTKADGKTAPIAAAAGETFLVEPLRYGYNFDTPLSKFTMGAQDEVDLFAISDAASLDNFEPNFPSVPPEPATVNFPVDLTATVNQSDDQDCYQFTPPAAGTYKLTMTPDEDQLDVDWGLSVEYLPDLSYPGSKEAAGIGSLIVNLPVAAPYLINVNAGGDLHYHLTVEAISNVFHVTGACTFMASPLAYVYIFNAANGDDLSSDDLGVFDLGWYPPGDYNFEAYLPGYQLGGGDPYVFTVHVEDADIVLPLDFIAGISDNFEPNDSFATAHSFTIGTDFSAVVGNGNVGDLEDYYYCNPTVGDKVWLQSSTLVGGDLIRMDVYDSAQNHISYDRGLDKRSRRVDFVATDPGGYYIRVASLGDYTISSGIAP